MEDGDDESSSSDEASSPRPRRRPLHEEDTSDDDYMYDDEVPRRNRGKKKDGSAYLRAAAARKKKKTKKKKNDGRALSPTPPTMAGARGGAPSSLSKPPPPPVPPPQQPHLRLRQLHPRRGWTNNGRTNAARDDDEDDDGDALLDDIVLSTLRPLPSRSSSGGGGSHRGSRSTPSIARSTDRPRSTPSPPPLSPSPPPPLPSRRRPPYQSKAAAARPMGVGLSTGAAGATLLMSKSWGAWSDDDDDKADASPPEDQQIPSSLLGRQRLPSGSATSSQAQAAASTPKRRGGGVGGRAKSPFGRSSSQRNNKSKQKQQQQQQQQRETRRSRHPPALGEPLPFIRSVSAPHPAEPIPLGRSVSSPHPSSSAGAPEMPSRNERRGRPPSDNHRNHPRNPFHALRRQSNKRGKVPSVSAAAKAATFERRSSWDVDDEDSLDDGYRDDDGGYRDVGGLSDHIPSSSEEEDDDEEDEDEWERHRRRRQDGRRGDHRHQHRRDPSPPPPLSSAYPLTRGVSDPVQGYRHNQPPLTPRSSRSYYSDDDGGQRPPSPLTDEDLMMSPRSREDMMNVALSQSSSISSSSDASLSSFDSDELLEEGIMMDRLAAELSTPRIRPGRSGRGRYLFRGGAGSAANGNGGQRPGRSRGSSAAVLEGVAEDDEEEEEDLTTVGPNDEELVTDDTTREETPLPTEESSPDTLEVSRGGDDDADDDGMDEGAAVAGGDTEDGHSAAEMSDVERGVAAASASSPPDLLPAASSSIQVSGSVEYFEYDPEAPLSPPPTSEYARTPVATNRKAATRIRNLPSGGSGGPGLFSFDTFEDDDIEAARRAGLTMPAISLPAAAAAATAAAAQQRPPSYGRKSSDVPSVVSAADTKSTFMSLFTLITPENMDVRTLVYLATFAIFGSTLRVYCGRLFGLDCEFPDLVGDFFSVGAKHICVTSSGRTDQTGGAMFIDLPANMIGSFLMGIMSSSVSSWPNIPWLKADHPLQQHNSMHIAIRTGLCGSLTTFASWNAQMVVMLDGTGLPLGRQILPAIFGYVLGLQAAIASFLLGRKVNTWMNRWKNPEVCIGRLERLEARSRRRRGVGRRGTPRRSSTRNSIDRTMRHGNRRRSSARPLAGVPEDIDVPGNDVMEEERRRKKEQKRKMRARAMRRAREVNNSMSSINSSRQGHHRPPGTIVLLPSLGDPTSDNWFQRFLGNVFSFRMIPFLLVAVLFSLYVVSDVVWDIPFYRTMWLSVIFTPPGAILRWKLQLLNGKFCKKRRWIPAGTIAANMIGSIFAIAAAAIETRFLDGNDEQLWSVYLLAAVKIGFAGSLSTVSSYVKEVVDITERYPSHAKGYSYAMASLICCCFLGLIVYSPIVRI